MLKFQEGDKVGLQMDKQRFKGNHHKLDPLQYGPYTFFDCIGENYYRLDLPPHFGIHDMLNVNNLKLFEPPLLEDIFTIHHLVENIINFQHPLLHDQIMDNNTRTTWKQQHVSYLVGRQGQDPSQAKWMTLEIVQ
jgi:hypothetical protein